MPDFKCVACRIRTRPAGDGAADACPECGRPLDLVDELAEIVGFRAVTTGAQPVDRVAPLGDFRGRRNAMYAQRVRDALDAERRLDDGGFAVAAVALPTSDRHAGAPRHGGEDLSV
jgi:hypothetical protein